MKHKLLVTKSGNQKFIVFGSLEDREMFLHELGIAYPPLLYNIMMDIQDWDNDPCVLLKLEGRWRAVEGLDYDSVSIMNMIGGIPPIHSIKWDNVIGAVNMANIIRNL